MKNFIFNLKFKFVLKVSANCKTSLKSKEVISCRWDYTTKILRRWSFLDLILNILVLLKFILENQNIDVIDLWLILLIKCLQIERGLSLKTLVKIMMITMNDNVREFIHSIVKFLGTN